MSKQLTAKNAAHATAAAAFVSAVAYAGAAAYAGANFTSAPSDPALFLTNRVLPEGFEFEYGLNHFLDRAGQKSCFCALTHNSHPVVIAFKATIEKLQGVVQMNTSGGSFMYDGKLPSELDNGSIHLDCVDHCSKTFHRLLFRFIMRLAAIAAQETKSATFKISYGEIELHFERQPDLKWNLVTHFEGKTTEEIINILETSEYGPYDMQTADKLKKITQRFDTTMRRRPWPSRLKLIIVKKHGDAKILNIDVQFAIKTISVNNAEKWRSSKNLNPGQLEKSKHADWGPVPIETTDRMRILKFGSI